MSKVKLYTGYLTEDKLECALKIILPKGEWIRNKCIPSSGRRFRPDFRNEHYKLVVEYDGHLHYTTARGAYNDIEKREWYSDLGYSVINIPYFIQIDYFVFKLLFSKHTDRTTLPQLEFTDFPHGFITDKCFLPADFCNLGIQRFETEMVYTFYQQAVDVTRSLHNKAKNLPPLTVDYIFDEPLSLGCDL